MGILRGQCYKVRKRMMKDREKRKRKKNRETKTTIRTQIVIRIKK